MYWYVVSYVSGGLICYYQMTYVEPDSIGTMTVTYPEGEKEGGGA